MNPRPADLEFSRHGFITVEVVAMPRYEFFCRGCKKFFDKVLSLVDHEAGEIEWPHCGSKGIGRRLCSLMEAILASDPKPFASDQPLREDIDSLLGTLVRMGIAEAHRLEESLRLI